VIALVGATISAVIFGLVWHWLIALIVERVLKGETDPHSRTNYFVMTFTAVAAMAVPSGLGILFGLIPLPLVGVVPLLLGLYTTVLMLFVTYSWFAHFQVVDWAKKVVLALGALAVLFAGLGTVTTIVSDVRRFVSGSGAVAVPAVEVDEAVRQAQALAALAAEGTMSPEQALAAAEAAANAIGQAAIEEARMAAESAAKVQAQALAAAERAAKEAEAQAKKLQAQAPDVRPAAVAVGAAAAGSFREFASRREQVETLLAEDPTLLRRPGVLDAYRAYHRKVAEISGKYPVDDPALAQVNGRLREVEAYEQTRGLLDEVHQKLAGR
jgi:hypothetical protein